MDKILLFYNTILCVTKGDGFKYYLLCEKVNEHDILTLEKTMSGNCLNFVHVTKMYLKDFSELSTCNSLAP